MRKIKYIVVHCTATSQKTTVASIQRHWRQKLGWKSPGYHFIILPDGSIVELLPITGIANGVAGFNREGIQVAYLGGIDSRNRAKDNRTANQKESLLNLLRKLKSEFPEAIIQGHRDFPNVKKACPSFDAKKEYETI